MTRTDPYFSVVMPYHAAPRMLAEHFWTMENLPSAIIDNVELVICDDASPDPISLPGGFTALRAQLLRIEPPHVRWSHRCATNIAAHHARGEWFIVTDMDHIVPSGSWRILMRLHNQGKLNPDTVYTFMRHNADGSPYKPHPDSWLIHRTKWALMGGYDTRYRGHYGQNAAFMDRVRHHAGNTVELDVSLTRYSRDDIRDASMPPSFGRKSDVDRNAIARLRREFDAAGTYYAPGEVIPHVRVYPKC